MRSDAGLTLGQRVAAVIAEAQRRAGPPLPAETPADPTVAIAPTARPATPAAAAPKATPAPAGPAVTAVPATAGPATSSGHGAGLTVDSGAAHGAPAEASGTDLVDTAGDEPTWDGSSDHAVDGTSRPRPDETTGAEHHPGRWDPSPKRHAPGADVERPVRQPRTDQFVQAEAGPIETGPIETGPIETGPAHTGPAHTGPAHTEPAHTEPAHTEPAHTVVAGTSPTEVADRSAPLSDPAGNTPAAAHGPQPAPEVEPAAELARDPQPGSTPHPDPRPRPHPGGDTVRPTPGIAAGTATALRAPTVLTPVVIPGGTGIRGAGSDSDGKAGAGAATAAAPRPAEAAPVAHTARAASPIPVVDPEQELAAYTWRFHHETLRELVDDPDQLRAVRDRLTDKLAVADQDAVRARLLSLRAVVSRILGDLTRALADGREALQYARATGELRRTAIVQARLAHVLQWRGDFAEADRLFAEANSVELPDRLRATMHEHAGRSCYDQGRFIEACNHFEQALDLRKVEDRELVARTVTALDAVLAQVRRKGWGPYPRTRTEILQLHRPPEPLFDEQVQLWGYADTSGTVAVPPRYADAQPFHEGAAWVRRPESPAWELIDESGAVLIDASAGYLGAASFSDGLAWVSQDGRSGWFAIDRQGRPVVPGGFDDVRPFRRGLAAVRRGCWGAVDRAGRVVVQFRYRGFATALVDGRYVDGFTDEGLAVVDAGDRKGVVDRTGQLVVAPVHTALVIHPVAFLVGDRTGRWGALDRRGEPLIDVLHTSRGAVVDEIDRLLADTEPVL